MIPDASPDVKSRLAGALLHWFATHRRDLPWRRGQPRDPYHVWLAEVMLQQTQVATVIPYYQRWLSRFPTLKDLAEAPVGDVLKAWEGLGYYARARNFHRAAQVVMNELGGRLPDTAEALLRLPGIGRYTAGAVASLAFGRDAPVLDGNVKRVLCRRFAIAGRPADLGEALWELSGSLLPRGRAGDFNEALMDLGATVCTPRAPACSLCPLRDECAAFALGNPEAYPTRAARAPLPHKTILTAVVFDAQGRVLVAQRPMDGLLGGLWEFPGGEAPGPATTGEEPARQLAGILRARTGLDAPIAAGEIAGQVRHAFTHFRITRQVAIITLAGSPPALHPGGGYIALRWATPDEIGRLALARSDQKIWQRYAAAARPAAGDADGADRR